MARVVVFKLDEEKDLRNIWRTCNKKEGINDFGKKVNLNKKDIELCKYKDFKDVKKELTKRYDKVYSSDMVPIVVKTLNGMWSKIEETFFERLNKVMKTKHFNVKITGYLTSIGKCPYNPDKKNPWFMVSLFSGIPNAMSTAAHEIMHLWFHWNYWNAIEEKIGKEKTADLKEALTVLLNLEFRDILLAYDRGYEMHRELRNFIEQEWLKQPDFDILLDKCISYLKKRK